MSSKLKMRSGKTLANKHRPKVWEDICGHTTEVTRLKGMIKSGELPSAFLISGPSGTGKTTIARVSSRYINCGSNTSCGKCDSCLAMDNNTSPDYEEIDAGSEGGVDSIRSIIQRARALPMLGNMRIFVIDEAQAITGAAQTALLKTLEEPPEQTLFILCTMQVEKINAAIKGRCCHLELKRVYPEAIKEHLAVIAKQEGIKVKSSVLNKIANACGGQLRDAIQILDAVSQAILGAEPDEVDNVIKSTLVSVTDVGDDATARDILVNLHKFSSSTARPIPILRSILASILDVQNPISFVNGALWQNDYLISSNVNPDHKTLYNTPNNLKLSRAVGQLKPVGLQISLIIQKHLVDLRLKLVQVSAQEKALMQAALYKIWEEIDSLFSDDDGE